jgi:hypothetical protein
MIIKDHKTGHIESVSKLQSFIAPLSYAL